MTSGLAKWEVVVDSEEYLPLWYESRAECLLIKAVRMFNSTVLVLSDLLT